MKLRNSITAARQRKQLSKSALAGAAGISRQTLAAIERDDGYHPASSVMTALCKALDDESLFWWEKSEVALEQPVAMLARYA